VLKECLERISYRDNVRSGFLKCAFRNRQASSVGVINTSHMNTYIRTRTRLFYSRFYSHRTVNHTTIETLKASLKLRGSACAVFMYQLCAKDAMANANSVTDLPSEDAQLAKRLEKQRMSTKGDLSGENGELDVIQCEGNRQSRISCEQ